MPKKRKPQGKLGDKEEADVGTVGYGIEVITTSVAPATR